MSLHLPAFRLFPINAIKPLGWLDRQLQLQVSGLSGNLDTFWPDVKDSAWIGGNAEGWERMPYWLDGAVPLAALTGNGPLLQRTTGYLDFILSHQHSDGWLGPRIEEKAEAADLWSQFLALKMLIGCHDAFGDERIPVAVNRCLRLLDRHIDRHPLSNWAQFRWFESLIAIWWLYDRNPEQWLLDLAVKLRAQGFHWQEFFKHWPLTQPTEPGRWNYAGHVVNNAMALKEAALWWRLSGDSEDLAAPAEMLRMLDRFHGVPSGVFTGDECLAGTGATQGTELCAIVEMMYSLECLTSILGAAPFADRLELVTFNALPAAFSPDMWSHQYDQQLNQIECSIREGRRWTTNSPDANIFGLEPNYGCCTANLSQGWPKFAAHQWMRFRDGGIAAVAYAPSRLTTEVDGVAVMVEMQTDYPFGEEIHFQVATQSPVRFLLLLRIPAWIDNAELDMDGARIPIRKKGKFHVLDRTWNGDTEFTLVLRSKAQFIQRPNDSVSLRRGPLLFALPIREEWRRINMQLPHRELPHADWEVFPTSDWSFAIDGKADDVKWEDRPVQESIFAPQTPPVVATVQGRRVPSWEAENGSAAATPSFPECDGPAQELRLIPYGCTNLRIAEFPVVRH